MPIISNFPSGSGKKLNLQTKEVSPSVNIQSVKADTDDGYDALEEVIINGAKLQTKSVTPSTSSQVVSPDTGYYGLDKVTVNAADIPEYETWTLTMSSGSTVTKTVGVSTL